MDSALSALGDAVKKRRLGLDLTQEQLAQLCNFDRTYISLIERGQRNPSFTNLLRLATGLAVSVSQLTKGI